MSDPTYIQHCSSLNNWSPISVESSGGKKEYVVLVKPDLPVDQFTCECEGFLYRGTCRHLRKALEKVCWWPILHSETEQTKLEHRNRTCPVCGERTEWIEDGTKEIE